MPRFSPTLFEQDSDVIRMPVQQWILLPDAPVQRDTARHAERAKKRHLRVFSVAHRQCVAAQLPNGDMHKIDGHTRAFLWNTGELERPDYVSVTVYQCQTLNEVCALYDAFDSKDAVETSQDKVYGSLRGSGNTPQSKLVAEGSMGSALSVLCNKKPIREAVELWRDEILVLDSLMIPRHHKKGGTLVAGEIAAFLATVRKHGDKAVEFWRGYLNGQGETKNGERCGREALRWYRHSNKADTRGGRRELCERAISACEAYIRGHRYKSGLRRTNLLKYLSGDA